MEQLLSQDILFHILKYLDRNNSFNLLNIATFMNPMRRLLYEKYHFNHEAIINNEIKKYINHLIIYEMINFTST